jgi:ubiquinone/menaquinone biosynthesis C-methylase UbiE
MADAPADAPADVPEASDVYTHGHHESVLRSHTWRTAENSAGYLLGELRPGMELLDIGCGPGTISIDLAARVAPGRVLGLDREAQVIEQAERFLSESNACNAGNAGDSGDSGNAGNAGNARNVSFVVGDVYGLELEDDSFDVVHAHQVLQHLTDPVKALNEMRRVLRPGGQVAVRDSDYGAKIWAPQDERLDRWMALYHLVTKANNAEADAGRFLPGWVRAAGFGDIRVSSSTWTFADPETCRWWGELWADRVQLSSFAEQAVGYGFADAAELASIAEAWRRWSVDPGAMIVIIGVEVLARK